MSEKTDFKLDIDAVLREKAKKQYKKIPKFFINYLKRTIRQEELNAIIERNRDKQGVDFMRALVDKEFKVKLKIHGEENIPASGKGRYIFASNHPLGGLDGICLSAYLGERYNGKIKYLVNDVLLNIRNLESIFVPVNKYGSQAKMSAAVINEAYASENQIITFPAGLCSRKQKGEIRDLQWMKNFVVKAVEYQRDIIPIHFGARNSNFFYNFANIRKALGIKFNIELIYLPGEMFKNKGETFHITFGKPIPWQSLDKSKSPAQWAEEIKTVVYNLPKQRTSKYGKNHRPG